MTLASDTPPQPKGPTLSDPDASAALRAPVVEQVRAMTPHLTADDTAVSACLGGREAALRALARIDVPLYGRTRNHVDGAVTRLSPYIRHGVLSLAEVRDHALAQVERAGEAEKFIQQLAWRDYWQRLYAQMGERVWEDIEPYKTGFSANDYAEKLPGDIATAQTGVAIIDHFLTELFETGWMHNHARLYVAGYVCHFRRVKWQAGAKLFLEHLLDGDPASNNLSWQWAASTFSHKPYFFNLENVQKFCGEDVDTSYANNKVLGGSYDDLHARLFPLLPPREPQGGPRGRETNRKGQGKSPRRRKRAQH